jgi:5-methylcytosine-specific restriction endonuclease McrA
MKKTPLKPSSKGLARVPLRKRGKRLQKYASRDSAARIACKKRAQGLCEVCGKAGNQTMHAISCDDLDYRWCLDNLFYGCQACHDDQRTPGGIVRFWEVIRDRYPERFAVIRHRARLVYA